METLTESQNHVLDAIKQLIAKNGYPPTVREIGEQSNLSSPATIHHHLSKLEEKGYIKKGGNKNRTLELLVPNEYIIKDNEIIEIPLIDKKKDKDITSTNTIKISTSLTGNKKDLFAITSIGETMLKIGIFNRDILIIEKQNKAMNNEIVIAKIENELVIGTYHKDKDKVTIQPQNDNLKPIISNEITILGKLISLYRKY